MGNMVTIRMNGCEVTVPAEQEQLYREALTDTYIEGCRVYVENGETRMKLSEQAERDGITVELMKKLILTEIHKLYALSGRL